jgi:predicted amidohydrolase YtcJ
MDLHGALEQGKEADLALLSQDIFCGSSRESGKTNGLITMAGMRLRGPLQPPARVSSDYYRP